MFNLFSSKSKLGIDIGTSSIKVIEIGKKGNRFELINYGLLELKGFTNSNNIRPADQSILKLPDEEIVWGIKEIIKKSDIKSKDVVASVPSFSTFTTVIEMPYLSDSDFEKAIPIEAKKYVPVPIDEVVLDWSIIGVERDKKISGEKSEDNNTSTETNVEVFLAAVPKAEATRYQGIMRNCGLNLKALELENSSLIRAMLGNDLSPTAIINIGGRSTSILIVDKGYERISHNYEIGGFEITKSIARSLNVSVEKAEELKRQFGLKPVDENIVTEAMSTLVDMMALETKKTITNYEETSRQPISRVVMTGGQTSVPHFLEYFKNRLGREVFPGNPFSRIVYDPALQPVITDLGNKFSVAVGLAIRDL
jgi:type IV pilus assembly protein PilM